MPNHNQPTDCDHDWIYNGPATDAGKMIYGRTLIASQCQRICHKCHRHERGVKLKWPLPYVTEWEQIQEGE